MAGVLFALLLTTALVLVRTATPGGPGDGSWLADPGRRRQVILALNLVPLSGIAFLWFIGVVRDRIGEREDRFFATVFLGRARDEMFAKTDTSWAPWYVIHSDDKRRTRLNIITHLLNSIDYKAPPRSKVKLPERQKPGSYREPDYPYKYIPEKY